MAEKDPDLQKIKELIEVMKENDLLELEVKHGDDKIFLKRCGPQPTEGGVSPRQEPLLTNIPSGTQTTAALKQPSLAPQQQLLEEIKSPIVGTFYATPSPDSKPYVEIGSHVEPQTVVCIIEAMKVMNEIKAETSGIIVEILVTNGQAVEYGQVLFRIKPD